MKISISDLLDYLDCPYKASVKRCEGRWTPPGAALSIGTAFHKGLELKLAGKPITGMDLEACAASCSDPKDGQVARKLLVALHRHTMPAGEARGSEVALSTSIGWPEYPITLVGRLDGLWETPDGKLWSLQAKTISASRPIAQELNRVRLSHHEVAYHRLAIENNIRLAGTLVIVGVKLTKKAEEAGQAMIFHEFMPRTDAEVIALWPGLLQRCRAAARGDNFKDTRNCLGKYGNSPCPLFAHCHQGADLSGIIDTMLTHKLEDRYSDVAE